MRGKVGRKLLCLCLAPLLGAAALSCGAPQGGGGEEPPARETVSYTLTEDALYDKLKGAWLGQMFGVTYAASTEFVAVGRMLREEEIAPWEPAKINEGFTQDDVYVEIPFLHAVEEYGLDITTKQFGDVFRETVFPLDHGNKEARKILQTKHIDEATGESVFYDAPMSGHYSLNQCCEDIDWMIEADWVGQMFPGMVSRAIDMADRAGQVIGYAEGVYGGVFVSALHAASFVAESVREIVDAGCAPSPL